MALGLNKKKKSGGGGVGGWGGWRDATRILPFQLQNNCTSAGFLNKLQMCCPQDAISVLQRQLKIKAHLGSGGKEGQRGAWCNLKRVRLGGRDSRPGAVSPRHRCLLLRREYPESEDTRWPSRLKRVGRERGVKEKVARLIAEQTGVSTRSCVSSPSVKDIKLEIPSVSFWLRQQQQQPQRPNM